MGVNLLSNVKVVIICSFFYMIVIHASPDSTFVRNLERIDAKNAIIIITECGNTGRGYITSVGAVDYSLYKPVYCNKYASRFDFLLAVMKGDQCFKRIEIAKLWRNQVVQTKISAEYRSKGLYYILKKYLRKHSGTYQLKWYLSKNQESDLIQILFRNGFLVEINDETGQPLFKMIN